MTFLEYYNAIKEEKIDELSFVYADVTYCIAGKHNKKKAFEISLWADENRVGVFSSVEELVALPCFDKKTLEQIWNDMESIEIYGLSESEYAGETTYNYCGDAELLWEFHLDRKKTYLHDMKIAALTVLTIVGLSAIFPLCGLSNYFLVALVGAAGMITLFIVGIALWKNNTVYSYYITSKYVCIFNGLCHEAAYENIKNVKLKKSVFKKSPDKIKIYVKKGWSINYTMLGVLDAEKAYNLIIENIKKSER